MNDPKMLWWLPTPDSPLLVKVKKQLRNERVSRVIIAGLFGVGIGLFMAWMRAWEPLW